MVQHENIGKHLDTSICLTITGAYGWVKQTPTTGTYVSIKKTTAVINPIMRPHPRLFWLS